MSRQQTTTTTYHKHTYLLQRSCMYNYTIPAVQTTVVLTIHSCARFKHVATKLQRRRVHTDSSTTHNTQQLHCDGIPCVYYKLCTVCRRQLSMPSYTHRERESIPLLTFVHKTSVVLKTRYGSSLGQRHHGHHSSRMRKQHWCSKRIITPSYHMYVVREGATCLLHRKTRMSRYTTNVQSVMTPTSRGCTPCPIFFFMYY